MLQSACVCTVLPSLTADLKQLSKSTFFPLTVLECDCAKSVCPVVCSTHVHGYRGANCLACVENAGTVHIDSGQFLAWRNSAGVFFSMLTIFVAHSFSLISRSGYDLVTWLQWVIFFRRYSLFYWVFIVHSTIRLSSGTKPTNFRLRFVCLHPCSYASVCQWVCMCLGMCAHAFRCTCEKPVCIWCVCAWMFANVCA